MHSPATCLEPPGLRRRQGRTAHGVGSVAGSPPEGGRRHRVRRFDVIGDTECPDGHESRLVSDPCEGAGHPAGEVIVGESVGRCRVQRLDPPARSTHRHRIGQVVAGEGDDRLGVGDDPGPAVNGFGGDPEREAAIVVEGQIAVVDGVDDSLGIAAVGGSGVDGQRQINSIAAVAHDAVAAARPDGRMLVVGVGVVATPLLGRPDDVDEAGSVDIAPNETVEGHLGDREQPAVRLTDTLLVGADLGVRHELLFERSQLVEDLSEDRPRLRPEVPVARPCAPHRHLSPPARCSTSRVESVHRPTGRRAALRRSPRGGVATGRQRGRR